MHPYAQTFKMSRAGERYLLHGARRVRLCGAPARHWIAPLLDNSWLSRGTIRRSGRRPRVQLTLFARRNPHAWDLHRMLIIVLASSERQRFVKPAAGSP